MPSVIAHHGVYNSGDRWEARDVKLADVDLIGDTRSGDRLVKLCAADSDRAWWQRRGIPPSPIRCDVRSPKPLELPVMTAILSGIEMVYHKD